MFICTLSAPFPLVTVFISFYIIFIYILFKLNKKKNLTLEIFILFLLLTFYSKVEKCEITLTLIKYNFQLLLSPAEKFFKQKKKMKNDHK